MKSTHAMVLLITCISFSSHSMDLATSTSLLTKSSLVPLSKLTPTQITDMQNLYNTTYENLENITRHSIEAVPSLLAIIEGTNNLKSQGITEQHLTKFACEQEISCTNHIRNHMHSPHNGPHYISVTFARIKTFNDFIENNKHTIPTSEEYHAHLEREKRMATFKKAGSLNLYINKTQLIKKNILTETPNSAAAQVFHQLIADIYAIRCESSESIINIAKLLYNTIDGENPTVIL